MEKDSQRAQALAAFEKAIVPARAAYSEAMDEALAAFEKAIVPARAAFDEAIVRLRKDQ